ncbi:ATP-grasp domain-containing protein [Aquisphaera insulae]|uniref:ATP-grasp domain-containing protein n=1 Tax=Aquisphaera insulae TaxID=2712864 RepID=UPI0013EBF4C0|nr:ATP-grasp domain-containing protein [Aquisphaera insulae]
MNGPHDLLIVGACTRAAAASAVRAGVVPRCVDHFADRDLAALGAVERVEPADETDGLRDRALSLPSSAWIYTGPLENHPDVVGTISSYHSLLGNPPDVLRAVRDPLRLATVLGLHGLPRAEVAGDVLGVPTDGSWLIKPRASGGGIGSRRLFDRSHFNPSTCYAQRFIAGPSFSALFLAGARPVELIGVSRQLIGEPGLPFIYRGSIGPCELPPTVMETLRTTGRVLAEAFGLIGLFGVDFVLHDGEPVPIEVNPRYTASVEVLEFATGRSLLAEHLRACGGGAPDRRAMAAAAPVVGKLILYAREALIAPDIPLPRSALVDRFALPRIADVPWPGTPIAAGEPILTVFARGESLPGCERRLRRAEEQLWRRIFWSRSRPSSSQPM